MNHKEILPQQPSSLGDVVLCDSDDQELGIIIRIDDTVEIPPLVTVFWSRGHFSKQHMDDLIRAF